LNTFGIDRISPIAIAFPKKNGSMPPSSSKRPTAHNPLFLNPWDSQPDEIDLIFWLKAIDDGHFALIAEYIQLTQTVDKRILAALADKLDPPCQNASRYVLKKSNGRPLRKPRSGSTAPIEAMLLSDDLKAIAYHLRTASYPDPLVRAWLTERLDPSSDRQSRFTIKRPRGRFPRQSELGKKICPSETRALLLGSKIHRKHKEWGKLESALQHFTVKSNAVPRPVSRSKARRVYDLYQQMVTRIKNPRI
jgi:hypothetical protein